MPTPKCTIALPTEMWDEIIKRSEFLGIQPGQWIESQLKQALRGKPAGDDGDPPGA